MFLSYDNKKNIQRLPAIYPWHRDSVVDVSRHEMGFRPFLFHGNEMGLDDHFSHFRHFGPASEGLALAHVAPSAGR